MALFNVAISALEILINRYLRLDPETIARLKNISGKIIKIEITDWNISIFLIPQNNGVQLFAEYEAEPDAAIRGKLKHLFRVAIQGAETHKLFENQIEIQGDIELGENIRNVLAQMDIDWEEQLSRITGDVLAHKINVGIQKTLTVGKQMGETLQRNLSEYLFEEAKTLPARPGVEELFAEIARLRDDVERIEARIQRLQKDLENGT